ncbi:MAG: hypothetical protein ACI906_000380 [Candidatus Latescibacterota bacterium]|jgi:hypothetical protein
MIRFAFALLFLLNACSLLQQDQPNEAPQVESTHFVCLTADGRRDTLTSGETCQLQRGGEVELSAFATDEDDDPLFYSWSAFGAGSFRDSLTAQTSWFAPESIQGNSELFLVQANIADRNCGAVLLTEDRRTCLDQSSTQIISFFVEVIQRPPTLMATSDTTISFSAPFVSIDALGSDIDGDVLVYEWEQIGGDNEISIGNDAIRDEESGATLGSRGSFIPFFPGTYQLRVSVSDGEDEVTQDIAVEVVVDNEPPDEGMVQLELPLLDGTTRSYEIDIYEYPNKKGERPQLAGWFDAAVLCTAQGKRLCLPEEWQTACQGGEAQRLNSSTDDPALFAGIGNFGLRYCNTDGSLFTIDLGSELEDRIAPAGSFTNCQPGNGVYDLIGNVREWTGSRNAFADWVPSSSFSSIVLGITEVDCTSNRPLSFEAFQGVDFDFSDPEAIQRFVDGLDNIDRDPLINQLITGFRCCR